MISWGQWWKWGDFCRRLLPLKFSHNPSRPVPVPEVFGKYLTRPVPKSKTPTRRTLLVVFYQANDFLFTPGTECKKKIRRSEFSQHLQEVHLGFKKKCPRCGKLISHILSRHIKEVHDDGHKPCPFCPKQFQSAEAPHQNCASRQSLSNSVIWYVCYFLAHNLSRDWK